MPDARLQCLLRISPRNLRVRSWRGLWKNSSGGASSTMAPEAMKITRFATCRAKFGNGASFRGFPHMPTADFIIGGVRPGDGALDGGSLFR